MDAIRPTGGGDGRKEKSLTKSEQRWFVVKIAVASFASIAFAAKAEILPYSHDEYTDELIVRDIGTAVFTGFLAFSYVKFITMLAKKKLLDPKDSRKLIHTFSAPLYMLLWPLYSTYGRYFAASVAVVNAARLFLAGTGEASEEELRYAVSRTGNPKEALEGPFIYVMIIALSILFFWRNSMIGILALSTMAAGDGPADLIGRRYGSNNKWPFAENKSVAGTLAFFLGAGSCSLVIAIWWSMTGVFTLPMDLSELAVRVFGVAAATALVEILPLGDDNFTVPLTGALLASILLQ